MLSLKGIMFFRAWTLILIAGVLCRQPAFAQDHQRIYQESTEALYNLDFSIAEGGFESLTRDYPDNPEYWNAMASTIWLKILYDQQKLNIESYSGAKLGTKESRDAINPADERRLRDTIQAAIARADAILKKNPNDIRALYALGNSYATLASFEGTAKRAYVEAHRKARQARRLHDRVLKLDPSFHDARLAVGAYDYVIGVIPRPIRWLLLLVGVGAGNKEGGLRQIETAASQGTLARTDARMLLVVIYNREKKYDRALRLIEELHGRYPRNFLFELAQASIYGKMKRGADAVRVYERVLAKIEAKKDGYERLREEKVYHELGTTNVERLQLDAAIDAFVRVARSNEATADEKASAHLWMGKIFDSRNERPKAIEQYNAVLGLNCDGEYKDEAQRYKRKPWGA